MASSKEPRTTSYTSRRCRSGRPEHTARLSSSASNVTQIEIVEGVQQGDIIVG